MSVPFTRTLPYVLRDAVKPSGVHVELAKVVSIPDSAHVRVDIGGSQVTVAKLASYTTPAAGEPCYLLVANSLILALGTVK